MRAITSKQMRVEFRNKAHTDTEVSELWILDADLRSPLKNRLIQAL